MTRKPLNLVTDEVRGATDEELVVAMQLGDRRAAGEFFARHGQRCARMIGRILGPVDGVEDVLQDVFVDVLRDVRNLREPKAVGGWLNRITVRRCYRELRGQRRRRARLEKYRVMSETRGSGPEGPELRVIYRALDRFPRDARVPWILHRIDGMSIDETAEACGVSASTVKRRIRRVNERLSKHYATLGGEA